MTETKTYKKKYKYKDETQTKCFQDPLYATFFNSREFKDIKYAISSKILPKISTKHFPQKLFH